jgi:diguanylate cyclase (GGDEF)-like protein
MSSRSNNNLGPRDPEQAYAHYGRLSPEERIALLVSRDAAIRLIKELHREAVADTVSDALTGVLNRRGLAAEYERSKQRHHRQSDIDKPDLLLMVDVDDFKSINDTQGHAGGDKSLQKVAGLISATVRGGDAVGRVGGDEFIAFLFGASLEEGSEVAGRLAQNGRILRTQEETAESSVIIPTLSVGVAKIDYSMSFDDVMASGDAAMYTAKQSGKDQFHILS